MHQMSAVQLSECVRGSIVLWNEIRIVLPSFHAGPEISTEIMFDAEVINGGGNVAPVEPEGLLHRFSPIHTLQDAMHLIVGGRAR